MGGTKNTRTLLKPYCESDAPSSVPRSIYQEQLSRETNITTLSDHHRSITSTADCDSSALAGDTTVVTSSPEITSMGSLASPTLSPASGSKHDQRLDAKPKAKSTKRKQRVSKRQDGVNVILPEEESPTLVAIEVAIANKKTTRLVSNHNKLRQDGLDDEYGPKEKPINGDTKPKAKTTGTRKRSNQRQTRTSCGKEIPMVNNSIQLDSKPKVKVTKKSKKVKNNNSANNKSTADHGSFEEKSIGSDRSKTPPQKARTAEKAHDRQASDRKDTNPPKEHGSPEQQPTTKHKNQQHPDHHSPGHKTKHKTKGHNSSTAVSPGAFSVPAKNKTVGESINVLTFATDEEDLVLVASQDQDLELGEGAPLGSQDHVKANSIGGSIAAEKHKTTPTKSLGENQIVPLGFRDHEKKSRTPTIKGNGAYAGTATTAVVKGKTRHSHAKKNFVPVEHQIFSTDDGQVDNNDDVSKQELDPEATLDYTSSLVVTARLVQDDEDPEEKPEFLEQDVQRRIQEGIELGLRAQSPHATTTVVAEALIPDPKGTCGLRPRSFRLLVLVGLVLIGGIVTGVVVAFLKDEQTPSLDSTTIIEAELEPWIVRSDSERALLRDGFSPQSRALDWLSRDNFSISGNRTTTFVLERYVLAVLYFSTDGPTWSTSSDFRFVTSEQVCNWNGGTCNDDACPGIACGNLASVESIRLNDVGLRGTIPWELSLLSNLKELALDSNALIGSIPTEIGQLTLLQNLTVSGNWLDGTIATELGLMTCLSLLNLYNNEITGTLPTELGQLTALETLAISSNSVTGTLPTEWGQLISLSQLYMEGNALTGTLPPELGLMTSLTLLNLYDNELTGTLPTELGQMTSLETIAIFRNFFSGTLPTEFGQLIGLSLLHLDDNMLSGTLPTELAQMTNLTSLNVKGNVLTGTILTELGQLSNLIWLTFHNNKLTGKIPTELGRLTALVSLLLGENALTGTLPIELVRMPALVECDIHSNALNGALPTVFGQMTRLTSLSLGDNTLTGTLPTELGRMTSLTFLSLYGNALTGKLPTALGQVTALDTIAIHNNSLTGPMPTELGKLTAVSWLFLSQNSLAGPLPTEMGQMSNLTSFFAQGNALTGTFPTELGALTKLSWLLVYDNALSGTIPTELALMTSIRRFLFHKNNLTGSVNDMWCAAPWEWPSLYLESDCLATNGKTEIECACCDTCCNVDGEDCQDMTYSG